MSVVASLNEINALPVGAVIRGAKGGVWEVDDPETDGTEIRYVGAGVKDYFTGVMLLTQYGPLTVIWLPPAAVPEGEDHIG